ncbi:MAG: aldo/keto reductase [Campylobacteraceae bacterium]
MSQSFKIPKITIGGNVFGWTLNENESFKVLDSFVENGLNFIDTANIYSTWVPGNKGGESEVIIGNWLKKRGKRDDIIIATKVGGEIGGKKGLSKANITKEVEDSLKRLKTDHIDLYISHFDDENTPVSDVIETYNKLLKEGKIKNIGASNFKLSRLQESNDFAKKNGLQGYISIQPEYNLYDREKFEKEYVEFLKNEKLIVTPYYSLASGFLSGKYKTEEDYAKSARGAGIKQKYFNQRGEKIIKALSEVAKESGATFSEVSIAWLLSKPYITSPIASATSASQVKELANAAKLKLSVEQVKKLDLASNY